MERCGVEWSFDYYYYYLFFPAWPVLVGGRICGDDAVLGCSEEKLELSPPSPSAPPGGRKEPGEVHSVSFFFFFLRAAAI